MQKMLVFGLMSSLHDVFTALWVGGLLTTALSLMPALKKLGIKSDPARQILKSYQNRLRVFTVISVVVLWITGLLLAKQSGTGFNLLSFATPYHALISVKHLIVTLMVMIGIYRGFILGRKVDDFTAQQQKMYAILIFINAFLGIVVLFLSGFSAAIA
ncbi:MAG: hypothetical protein ACOX7C_02620 [Brevefilum sp.]|jgi:putative copper export protein